MDERKQRVLQAVVQDYIESAEPVGSRTIARRHDLGVSPATIRNEMADLEMLGYLEHIHTSSGRIPSSKGYRFYVDLMRLSGDGAADFPRDEKRRAGAGAADDQVGVPLPAVPAAGRPPLGGGADDRRGLHRESHRSDAVTRYRRPPTGRSVRRFPTRSFTRRRSTSSPAPSTTGKDAAGSISAARGKCFPSRNSGMWSGSRKSF